MNEPKAAFEGLKSPFWLHSRGKRSAGLSPLRRKVSPVQLEGAAAFLTPIRPFALCRTERKISIGATSRPTRHHDARANRRVPEMTALFSCQPGKNLRGRNRRLASLRRSLAAISEPPIRLEGALGGNAGKNSRAPPSRPKASRQTCRRARRARR